MVPEQTTRHRRWQGHAGAGKRNGEQASRGSGAAKEDSIASRFTTLLGTEGQGTALEDNGPERSHGRCQQEEGLSLC